MNKNGLQVLENIDAAQMLISMTGVNIIRTFSGGQVWKPLIYARNYNHLCSYIVSACTTCINSQWYFF